MPNVYSIQTLKDTTEHAVIKLTAQFDGSGQESNTFRIVANTLYGALDANNVPLYSALSASNTAKPYYNLALTRVWYDCSSNGDVNLVWSATTPVPIFWFNGNGEYDGFGNWVAIPNNAQGTAGANGNIGIVTRNMNAGDSYTVILEVRKDNAHYQRGQFNDPAAFNYGSYALKP